MTPTKQRTFRAKAFGAAVTPQSLGKPAAAYPAAVATDSDMTIAVDRQQTRLALPLNTTDTAMTVVDPSMIVPYCLLTIDSETVKVTGPPAGNVVPISRGFDGTTAAVHLASASVSGFIDAYHHNRLVAEVEAIEQTLGPNLSNIASVALVVSTAYAFPPQTPGGSLTVGTNSITLTPVPKGVNGSNVNHYLYISGGTGAAEAVKITGGSAVSGAASGQIFVTCANTHSGAWTIQTATAGIQEALYSAPNPITITIPNGNHTLHGPTTLPLSSAVCGQSMYGVYLNVASDFLMTATGVFVGPNTLGNGPALSGFTVTFIQPDSTSIATYTHWPPAFYMVSCSHFKLISIMVLRAWDVVKMTGNAGGAIITDFEASHFHIGIEIDGALDSTYLTRVRFWVYGLTNNQITVFQSSSVTGISSAKADDLELTSVFLTCGIGIRLWNSGGGATQGLGVDVYFDSVSQMVYEDANFIFTNLSMSLITNDKIGIAMGASVTGLLTLNNCDFVGNNNAGTAQPWISMSSGTLQVNNSRFTTYAVNMNSIAASGGRLMVNGCLFSRISDQVYTAPTVAITGAQTRATLIGNRATDKGVGAGTFISIASPNYHVVRANSFVGWSSSYPADRSSGVYEDGSSMQYPIELSCAAYNLIRNETGANNAIAGALSLPLNAGLSVMVILSHTLQAGANTFNYNATGALPIKSHRTITADIAVGYQVGAMINLITDGTRWFDLSQ